MFAVVSAHPLACPPPCPHVCSTVPARMLNRPRRSSIMALRADLAAHGAFPDTFASHFFRKIAAHRKPRGREIRTRGVASTKRQKRISREKSFRNVPCNFFVFLAGRTPKNRKQGSPAIRALCRRLLWEVAGPPVQATGLLATCSVGVLVAGSAWQIQCLKCRRQAADAKN